MPDYTQAPHVTATIDLTVGSEEADFGPGDAMSVKANAADWLRNVCDKRGPRVRGKVEIAQTSLDVPWQDHGEFRWKGDAEHGREYAAQFCERFPEWGRGR